MSDLPVEESKGSTAEQRRAFARELADPNFSLSVPSVAKKAIVALLEDVRVCDERIAAVEYTLQRAFDHGNGLDVFQVEDALKALTGGVSDAK